MFALAVTVETLLPSHVLQLAGKQLARDRQVGIIGKCQKGTELLEESVFGIGIGGAPARGRERILDLILRADEKQVNYVRIFTTPGGGAVRLTLQERFHVAAFVLIHSKRNAG